ncbi:MAG: hypothetical protein N2512_15760, partial [Armatimonadetes bacterium]|nr:hypothetical protein [Armatimonadota bacterium]
MAKLAEVITTAPGFRAAVRLVDELDDFEKAAAYIPTRGGAEVLFDVGRQIEPTARQRARLITGSYGTGKSHLALVLAAIYRGLADKVAPVLDRLGQAHPGRFKTLTEALSAVTPQRKYLVVVLEGDQDDFNAALVRGLRAALDKAGLGDYMPRTYFSAAADRLEELMSLQDAHERLERMMGRTWRQAVRDLVAELRAGSHEALVQFEDVHRQVCFGAPFLFETRVQAEQTFRECAEQLVASG